MSRLYIDASMGAAGDMLTAALLELFDNKEDVVASLNNIGIPSVEYIAEDSIKCGIKGTHVRVLVHGEEEGCAHHHHDDEHHHHHHHSSLHDIEHIVSHLNLSEKVKNDVMAVYSIIAEAESKAHGVKVEEVHFHEVGAMDAVADVAAVSFLMDKLNLDEVVTSAIHVGSGCVRCAHGVLPVPAPATLNILCGVPFYSGDIKGELCTPTGAALLKYFSTSFSSQPEMVVSKVGYGMGNKDFERANAVRVLLECDGNNLSDQIVELQFQVDDMTGEEIGFALDEIFSSGAVDAYWTSVAMKKNRPGTLITVFSKPDQLEEVVSSIFKNTTTIGIRRCDKKRYILEREIITKDGLRYKKVSGYGVDREKAEFDDLASKAREEGKSLLEVKKGL